MTTAETPKDQTSAEATSAEATSTQIDKFEDDDDFQWTDDDAVATSDSKSDDDKPEGDTEDDVPPLGEEDQPESDNAELEFKPGNLAETLKLRDEIPDDVKKSILDHAKGIDKVANRFNEERKAFEEQAAELTEFHERARGLEAALGDKGQFPATIARLLEAVAKHHGLDAEEIGYEIYEWIADGKVPPAPQATKAGTTQEEDRIAKLEQEIAALKQEKAPAEKPKADARETRVNAWLDTNSARVIAKAEKVHGWSVTREQIKVAVTAHPSIDPIEALKKSFPDDYKKAGTKGTATVPTIAKTEHRNAALSAKKPEEMTARDVYEQLGLG